MSGMVDVQATRPRASHASKPKVRTGCLRCRYAAIGCSFCIRIVTYDQLTNALQYTGKDI